MLALLISAVIAISNGSPLRAELTIDVWYGDEQQFGRLGHAQKWVNILGHVSPADEIKSLSFELNGAEPLKLSFHEDRKRIARDGDFNIEIDRALLMRGRNTIDIIAVARDGTQRRRTVMITYHADGKPWPLPYVIQWSNVKNIQDVAQVVDGRWTITNGGVRSVEPYYDRILAVGDSSWRDYEIETTVTVHALTGPKTGPNATNVTHAALALRWPGHDADGNQPSVKWYPLGATAEFRLGGDLSQCRWRIFDGKRQFYVESERRRRLDFETPYRMKHRVETLTDGRSRYRVKLWPSDKTEPSPWDLERTEPDDLLSGSACLIAHHSDVTFGDVTVRSLEPADQAATPKPGLSDDD